MTRCDVPLCSADGLCHECFARWHDAPVLRARMLDLKRAAASILNAHDCMCVSDGDWESLRAALNPPQEIPMTPHEIRERLAGEPLPADLGKALDDLLAGEPLPADLGKALDDLLDEVEQLRPAIDRYGPDYWQVVKERNMLRAAMREAWTQLALGCPSTRVQLTLTAALNPPAADQSHPDSPAADPDVTTS